MYQETVNSQDPEVHMQMLKICECRLKSLKPMYILEFSIAFTDFGIAG